MNFGVFTKNSTLTFFAAILNLVLGILVSVIIARLLGPEGKGIYTLATLFSYFIVTFGSFGLPSAFAFYVAQQRYSRQELLGNSVLLSLLTGSIGVIAGLVIAALFGRYILPGVPAGYLLLALLIVPWNMLVVNFQYVLLGAQHTKEYNILGVVQSFLWVHLTILFLWIFKGGIAGALIATVLSWVFVGILGFAMARKIAGGIALKLNLTCFKNALMYSLQIHVSSILRLLSLRVNLLLVNGFLNPAAVGFYSISVGLTEKLWLISQSAATVLFPKIAAEKDERRKKEFTPIVVRTVLWITILVALLIVILSRWLISFLYSDVFLPAVKPLRVLMLGTVAMSISQVLGNDIAGRGQAVLNIYSYGAGFITVIVFSVLWTPHYGIEGAAWSFTVSCISNLVIQMFLYMRISGNSLRDVLLPRRTDWTLYWHTGKSLLQWASKEVGSVAARAQGRNL